MVKAFAQQSVLYNALSQASMHNTAAGVLNDSIPS